MNEDAPQDGPPCAVALLAATIALMTGHAAPEPGARVDAGTLQRLMARKIVSNLFFLRHHPDLSPGLHQLLAGLHARWSALAAQGGEVPADPVHASAGPKTSLH